MKIDTKHFKEKLEAELKVLEEELNRVGRRNPDNPEDWEAVPEKWDTTGADKNETADSMEEFEENTATLKQLEIRYNNVKKALKKIEDGTYGIDEVDGKPIPLERLEANPSAKTKVENAEKVED
jgi:RNA polymerase-binding transcription factor DksA